MRKIDESKLLMGDLFAHQDGQLIPWGQWNAGNGNYKNCHIDFYGGGGLVASMPAGSPPWWRPLAYKSGTYMLSEIDADKVDVLRLRLSLRTKLFESGSRFPGTDPEWCKELRTWVACNRNQPYGFKKIGGFLVDDLAARIGGIFGQRWAKEQQKKDNVEHMRVCSIWAEDGIQDTTRKVYNWLDFNLFPGIGEDNARPCDFIPENSPYLIRVSI